MSTDVDKARTDLERAERRAAEARAKAEEAAQFDAQRRAERQRRFDQAVLALYDEQALQSAVSDAQAALEVALDADPVVRAAVALRQCQGARHGGAVLANSIRQRLGLEPVTVPGPGAVDLPSAVRAYIERRGAELVADGEDQFHEAREAAANE